MTHEAATYLNKIFYIENNNHRPLDHYQFTLASQLLKKDATKYLYSSILSLSDAIRGIDQNFCTWSGVKLYYSLFYSLRCMLSMAGHGVFYKNRSPQKIKVSQGQLPINTKGTTHEVIIKLFIDTFQSNIILSQEINNENPLRWVQARREEFNYKVAKFSEPETPECFRKIRALGIRQAFSAYVNDTQYQYCFDPDHAILALPIELIKHAKKTYNTHDFFDQDEKEYLTGILCDRNGPLNCNLLI